MKVLVVDDDETILDLVQQMLNLSGRHDAVAVQSAKAALRAIGETEDIFDCVFTDIQMPALDGVTLVRLIRQTPGYRNVPIVMLTAMEDRAHLNQAFSAGATDYITKPFEMPDLLSRLSAGRKLGVEKTRHQNQPLMEGEMKGMGANPKDVRLSDPIPLCSVEGAIDYAEFENYVRQLTRRRLSESTVLAIKIASVERVYKDCTSDEYRTLVGNAALAVQNSVVRGKGVFSYRGDGVFLCIRETPLNTSWRVLQTALNDRFRAIQQGTGRIGAELRVGNQIGFKSVSEVDLLEALSAAVDSVETRSVETGAAFKASGRFLSFFRPSREEQHLEKRAYEAILNRALSETDDTAWLDRLQRREKAPNRSREHKDAS